MLCHHGNRPSVKSVPVQWWGTHTVVVGGLYVKWCPLVSHLSVHVVLQQLVSLRYERASVSSLIHTHTYTRCAASYLPTRALCYLHWHIQPAAAALPTSPSARPVVVLVRQQHHSKNHTGAIHFSHETCVSSSIPLLVPFFLVVIRALFPAPLPADTCSCF